eukprot:CAMPEP_0174882972 /NCGR_PEP_ID=MMETSP1114-20130205/85033_1 /TAXON_ID=312471 /ORGANISM="Neobodo designis, Strain CCAP 1951/1" /LENGTH=441 /DNA_ID=CAMNT_0016118373 /DNA_START=44 /DNA_END=1365 /DNA_ORIENTATION=+
MAAAAMRGASSLQSNVLNDVLFHTTDVEVALNAQVQRATKVASQLEKRLFALQAEQQQARDTNRSAASILAELQRSRQLASPRNGGASTPRSKRRLQTPMANPDEMSQQLDGAIDAVSGAVSMLGAIDDEMRSVESRLCIQIKWLHDMINRDSDCLTAVNCRKQRAKEYRHAGGVQLSSEMDPTEWPTQANATFLEAGAVMNRSAEARKGAYEVCRHAQLMAARAKKAANDAIAQSVTARLEQRHALQCQLERIAKQQHDTTKTLDSARANLETLREPLRVALARQSARHEIDDGVGEALKSEKATVVRGYRQLRHLTKQLESDLASARSHESAVRAELETLERDLATDRSAMMAENAVRVTLAPQPPQRPHMRVFAQTYDPAPNPIAWDGPNAAASARELPFSLWNNACARQYPGQRRDPKSMSPREAVERRRAAEQAAR